MTATSREKSSQSNRIYFGALRDEKLGAPEKCTAFFGVEYRRFVSYSVKEAK